jgi:hypothetical protein
VDFIAVTSPGGLPVEDLLRPAEKSPGSCLVAAMSSVTIGGQDRSWGLGRSRAVGLDVNDASVDDGVGRPQATGSTG